MPQVICKLTFATSVRFGSDAGGSSMTGTAMAFHADVLFSALFRALRPLGKAERLLQAALSGELAFSDAFPWRNDRQYLPRPVGMFAKAGNVEESDPSERKLLKRIKFVPVEVLGEFMNGCANLQALYRDNHFGNSFENTRVNRRDGDQPLPYRLTGFRFDPECGLYVVVRGTEDALALFEEGMTSLSAEGLGGKTSSGWGKFAFAMEDASPVLARMLDNVAAPRQMLLSTALPSDEELSGALDGAFYTVVRRGGFVFSEATHPMKKRTVYFLGAGSTFSHRFEGTILDVGVDLPHPVWRYARALFLGVEA